MVAGNCKSVDMATLRCGRAILLRTGNGVGETESESESESGKNEEKRRSLTPYFSYFPLASNGKRLRLNLSIYIRINPSELYFTLWIWHSDRITGMIFFISILKSYSLSFIYSVCKYKYRLPATREEN